MAHALTLPLLRGAIQSNALSDLADQLGRTPNAELAKLLGALAPADSRRVLQQFSAVRLARIFEAADTKLRHSYAALGDTTMLAGIAVEMRPATRLALLRVLGPNDHKDVSHRIDELAGGAWHARALRQGGTAGSLMTGHYVALRPELTVAQALDELRVDSPDKETTYHVYLIDPEKRIVGAVSLRDLLVGERDARIDSLARHEVVFAYADESREEVVRKITRHDLFALPVVDADEVLVGVITHNDAMTMQSEESTEDFHASAGVGKLVGRLATASVWTLYRARVAWLLVLVFGNLFSGAGIAAYEETIAAYVALVFFLPLLIDSGGNAGSQAATLMVRALATGDVKLSDWGRMLVREFRTAALLGLSMAVAVSAIAYMRGGPDIAVVVAVSMVVIVLIASCIGLLIPFALAKFKLDPAAASAPLITSIADAVGVLIYLAFATSFLPPPPL